MHRLTNFIHNIVSNINYIRDWFLTDKSKSSLHPVWRFSNLNIIYIVAYISWADILCLYCNLEAFLLNICLCVVCSRHLKRLIKYCSNFSCKTEDALAVRSVSCNRYIKDVIIKTKKFFNILAKVHIIRKN